jgi:ribosomal protein S9
MYDIIINAIKINGGVLFGQKRAVKNAIKALTTVQQCIDFENEPYDYIVTQEDVDNDPEGTLTVGETIVKHRNNVKEW